MKVDFLQENRFQVSPSLSNRKLRDLCRFYKIFYDSKRKERTLAKVQSRLTQLFRRNKERRIASKEECIICYEVLTETMLITRCLHAYCDTCIIPYVSLCKKDCPLCRQECQVKWFIEDNQMTEERRDEILPIVPFVPIENHTLTIVLDNIDLDYPDMTGGYNRVNTTEIYESLRYLYYVAHVYRWRWLYSYTFALCVYLYLNYILQMADEVVNSIILMEDRNISTMY